MSVTEPREESVLNRAPPLVRPTRHLPPATRLFQLMAALFLGSGLIYALRVAHARARPAGRPLYFQPRSPMRRPLYWRMRQHVYWRIARSARRVHGRGPMVVAIGDSNTDPSSGYTLPWQVWLRIVAREGHKIVNLGVSGDTTADMRQRIEQTLGEGRPEIVVVFGGANDAFRGTDPEETERNVTFMVDWLREQGIRKIVLIGPGLMNWGRDPDWAAAGEQVRTVLKDIAERRGAIFVDLARFLRDRIEHGEDPDFSRVPYRQSRSWHVQADDPHFNAYGQRLIAEAFLAATAEMRRPP